MGSPMELKMRPGELTRVPKSPMHFPGSSLGVCMGFEVPRHSGRSLGPGSLQRTRLQAQITVCDALYSWHSVVLGMPRGKMHAWGQGWGWGWGGGGVGRVGLDPGTDIPGAGACALPRVSLQRSQLGLFLSAPC